MNLYSSEMVTMFFSTSEITNFFWIAISRSKHKAMLMTLLKVLLQMDRGLGL